MAKQQDRNEKLQEQILRKRSRLFPCRFEGCSAVFKKLSHLSRHELIHNDIRPFPCTFEGCDKAYRSSSHLKRHEITHSGEKMFCCEYEGCDVACYTAWNLRRHVKRTHEGSFKCEECDKDFKKKKLLEEHISLEHKKSTVSCSFPGCAQIFKNATKMRRHQKSHSSKGYVCSVKGCARRFSLYSECRMHTAECKEKVPRNCDVCGKTFSTRSNLKAHKQVHDAEREVFICQYKNCSRYYTKQSNLKAHVQSFHMGIRPFYCPKTDCNRSYTYKHLLRKHLDWHDKKDHGRTNVKSAVRRRRPKRMVTSDLSAITGYIPELWTKMTPAEVNAYVNEHPDMFDPDCMVDTDIIPHEYETTQAEMTPMTSGDLSSIMKSTTVESEEESKQGPSVVKDSKEIHKSDTDSEDTLTARISEFEFDDDELGMILEKSTLEEASVYLDRINQPHKHTSSSSSNDSSRASSVCSGINEGMKLIQQYVSQHKKDVPDRKPGSPIETCRMQSSSRTESDSSDTERNLLCAS